jgi:hypothetical protein
VIALVFGFVFVVVLFGVAMYLLGFRLGGAGHLQETLTQVRLDGLRAQQRVHDLSRQAFVAILEEARRRRQPGDGPSDRNEAG